MFGSSAPKTPSLFSSIAHPFDPFQSMGMRASFFPPPPPQHHHFVGLWVPPTSPVFSVCFPHHRVPPQCSYPNGCFWYCGVFLAGFSFVLFLARGTLYPPQWRLHILSPQLPLSLSFLLFLIVRRIAGCSPLEPLFPGSCFSPNENLSPPSPAFAFCLLLPLLRCFPIN